MKGRQYVSADIDDTGGRAIDLSGTVRLSHGPGGVSAGPFGVSQIFTLAPGQSIAITFPVPRMLPIGPWLASLRTVSGLNVQQATATIKFDNRAVATGLLGESSLIWLSGLAALLLLGGFAFWRARRSAAQAKAAHRVVGGEAVIDAG